MACTLGIWLAGATCVPLCTAHPPAELAYYVADSAAVCILAATETELATCTAVRDAHVPGIPVGRLMAGVVPPATPCQTLHRRHEASPAQSWDAREALVVYTSGTTGRPKGALHTHGSLRHQMASLCEAWGWTERDHALCVLPLHHIHGIVNVVYCALWAGAGLDLMPKFDAERTWACLADKPGGDGTGSGGADGGAQAAPRVSFFSAVPTIYVKLLRAYDAWPPEKQREWGPAAAAVRVMISGSAACPEPVMSRWREVTGATVPLLERYGMTETGMIISNPLHGHRQPGAVGQPLRFVEVRVVGTNGEELTLEELAAPAADAEPVQGQLQVCCGHGGRSDANCTLSPDCLHLGMLKMVRIF